MTEKTRRIILDVNQHTFEMLEALVVGLHREESWVVDEDLHKNFSKAKNDFGPGVAQFLNHMADSLSSGVARAGCWERSCLESLTGYSGTYVPDSLGPLAKVEFKRWEDLYEMKEKNIQRLSEKKDKAT